MPRVKIDYIVSFSSEDPEHPAKNLLEWEVSKKKWLCSKGESSCSVVLQLNKAVKIESINIGAYHAASVEVLVGLSEKPNDPFQVLVPSCMLLSPAECRRDTGVERVRSFSGDQLAAARDKRWDRVRVVCTQPYNKHCKYGLSFVHIHSPEGPVLNAFSRTLALDALPSDEEDFRPGELFAQHSQRASTDAQIRKASMEAIKNNSDQSTKLLKTPIHKKNNNEYRPRNDKVTKSNRKNENLMYTDDDDKPHAKIDQVVQRHNQQKDKEKPPKTTPKTQTTGQNHAKDKVKLNTSTSSSKENKTEAKLNNSKQNNAEPQERLNKHSTPQRNSSEETPSQSSHKKRKRSDQTPVLAGVQFTLSGYENPLRGQLRTAALALGATYLPVWKHTCTHLVCAFPNTPKLREARANGSQAVAVTGDWLLACEKHKRKLPWRWFATETKKKEKPPAGWERQLHDEDDDDTELDTDDEIEKVLLQQENKRKRLKSPDDSNESNTQSASQKSPRPDPHQSNSPHESDPPDESDAPRDVCLDDASRDSDVTFVRDERVRAHVALDSDTDADEPPPDVHTIDTSKELPNFFDGMTFTIAEDLDPEYDRALLTRYIRAYGGLVVESCELLEDSADQILVCSDTKTSGVCGVCVRPEWVWRCHRLQACAPLPGRT